MFEKDELLDPRVRCSPETKLQSSRFAKFTSGNSNLEQVSLVVAESTKLEVGDLTTPEE